MALNHFMVSLLLAVWRFVMGLILLEALGALLLLVLIVWWTMFSGRKGGEPPTQDTAKRDADQ
jgi:hypothetical protein